MSRTGWQENALQLMIFYSARQKASFFWYHLRGPILGLCCLQAFYEHGPELVCGAIASVRPLGGRIALWLSTPKAWASVKMPCFDGIGQFALCPFSDVTCRRRWIFTTAAFGTVNLLWGTRRFFGRKRHCQRRYSWVFFRICTGKCCFECFFQEVLAICWVLCVSSFGSVSCSVQTFGRSAELL